MKAILLLLAGLASLMGAQLDPVSAIDFSQALRVPPHYLFTAIGTLGATSDGPMVSCGLGCDGFDPGMARSDKTGASITRIDFPAAYGQGGDVIPMPDGSWWLQTSNGPGLPAVMPCRPPGSPPAASATPAFIGQPQGFIPASAKHGGGSTIVPVQNFDFFAKDGRRVESFREFGAGNLSPAGAPSPSQTVPGADKIALTSPG